MQHVPSTARTRDALEQHAYDLGSALRSGLTGAAPSNPGSVIVDEILWWIEHHPGSSLHRATRGPCTTHAPFHVYTRLRDAWLAAVAAHPDDAAVLVNAAHFSQIQEPDRSRALFEAAHALEPRDPSIARDFALSLSLRARRYAVPHVTAFDREEARQALAWLETALALQRDAGPDGMRELVLAQGCDVALGAEEEERAAAFAQQYLDLFDGQPPATSGGAVYVGNATLGRVALRRGDLEEAKRRLLAAGRTFGSPALSSFGPDMSLASELYDRGEHAVVREFLELCRAFWKAPHSRLDGWIAAIDAGKEHPFARF